MTSVLIGLAAYLIFYGIATLFGLPTDDLHYWAVIAMLLTTHKPPPNQQNPPPATSR